MNDAHDTIHTIIIEETEKHLGEKPRIILTGKTGMGKSSLINALLNKDVAVTHASRPCTHEEQEEAWNIGESSLRILDVPSFGEADVHANRVDFILDHLPSSHVGLLVVGAPDRAWEHERQFVETLRTVDPDFPLLVVGNRIDMFNPLREWNPATSNLSPPHTAKEKNICEWAAALQTACGVDSEHIVLTSAGESFADVQGRYGLDILARRVVDTLPSAVQNVAARAMRVDVDKRRLAEKIIWGASVAAAGGRWCPFPLPTPSRLEVFKWAWSSKLPTFTAKCSHRKPP